MPASWAADPGESELAISATSDHLAKIERAVSRTRASHAGQPSEVVHLLLSEALRDEGAERSVAQQGPHGMTTNPCQHPVHRAHPPLRQPRAYRNVPPPHLRVKVRTE
ncbi:hypothetical protein SFR_3325 [Streptomyces sp. FR-008]|nr:hypothetical protein SFR_3325 [Streptomyces sp. FR-008]